MMTKSQKHKKIHLVLLVLWVVVGLPVSFLLREQIAWLTFMSVYAIIVGHWSALEAADPEVGQ